MRTTCSLSRRRLLQLAGTSVVVSGGLGAALAQNAAAPLDLARIVVGAPPGTVLDLFCRRVADALAPAYARSVIVENKVGAAGQIAVSFVKTAPHDGSTILVTPMPMMGIYPHTYRKLPYDPVADFLPVSIGALFDLAFAVGPMVPPSVKTLPEFFEWCKANPARANFGSPAAGSTPHFVGSMAARAAGTEITHVPFRGTTPAILDMIGGQIAAVCATVGDFTSFVEAGKCRVLGTTGARRSRFSPNVPTFVEQGYKDVVLDDWYGLFLATKTPQAQVQRLSDTLKLAMTSPVVVRALEEKGLEARWSTPDELAARLRSDLARWEPIVKSFNFTAES